MARRRVIARRRQAQRAAAFAERQDGLHRALAERGHAQDGGAVMVLQRAGHDLRRRGGAGIDQHNHRLAVGDVAGMGVVAAGVLGVAAAGRDHFAGGQEIVGDLHRLVEQTARIVAQVENVALDARGRSAS